VPCKAQDNSRGNVPESAAFDSRPEAVAQPQNAAASQARAMRILPFMAICWGPFPRDGKSRGANTGQESVFGGVEEAAEKSKLLILRQRRPLHSNFRADTEVLPSICLGPALPLGMAV